MARTKRTKRQPTAIERYRKAKPHKKKLTYEFYLGHKTDGKEGYRTSGIAPGSVAHYKRAGSLKTWYTPSQFYSHASVSIVCCFCCCCCYSLLLFCYRHRAIQSDSVRFNSIQFTPHPPLSYNWCCYCYSLIPVASS